MKEEVDEIRRRSLPPLGLLADPGRRVVPHPEIGPAADQFWSELERDDEIELEEPEEPAEG